ncbi:MAG: hypothetical protein JXB06_13885 [Spirochaetales bacterium]|nr:hypothetical protein [Spirochaetales bacterium]
MKTIWVALVLLLFSASAMAAQETIDVVYLVDGQVIRGKIVERETYPEERIKIEAEDGTIYVVKMTDVERIAEQTVERAPERTAGQSAEAGEDPPLSPRYVSVNLLGFLQWGPSVAFGFAVAEDLFLVPHIRLDGLGALNWIIYPDDTYIYTPAFGLTVLHFMDISQLNANRLYYGGGLEIEAGGEVPFEETVANIFGNVGYRWRTVGRKRFLNVGAHVGASYDFWWEELMIFAMAELSFGWDLGG